MNILVIRFSALGDVAIAAIAIESILKSNPDVNIWFLSKPFHKPLFNQNPRFHFIESDLKKNHKGILGLKKLTKEILEKTKIDAVIDLHDVLRTKVLRRLLNNKVPDIYCFNKGRKEKKNMLNGITPFKKLPHSVSRYLSCFNELELNCELQNGPWLMTNKNQEIISNKKQIGIAPFAAHKSKEWGINKIRSLIGELKNVEILLFGGGQNEIKQLVEISTQFSNCTLVAGNYSFKEELEIIAGLDLMISMDSANMHLATLVGTKVISIWGPTHHFLGFGPLMNENLIVEIDRKEMPCRPCSIYGKVTTSKQKECATNSMRNISVNTVVAKIKSVIN